MRIEDHISFISTILELEVVSALGKGEFGAVYLAKQGDRSVAVKLPLTKTETRFPRFKVITDYKQSLDHLRREHEAYVRAEKVHGIPANSELQQYSSHFFTAPNCIPFVSPATHAFGIIVLIRDYIVGTALQPREVISNLTQKHILEKIVRDCHAAGIVGLDIKRENTIRGPRDRLHLIDFGEVRFEEDLFPSQVIRYADEDFRRLKQLYVPS